MGYTSFSPKSTYVPFYHEGIRYCTAHKYSTESVINASSLINKLIVAITRQCSHTVYVSKSIVKSIKPDAFSRFFLTEFVYDTSGGIYIQWRAQKISEGRGKFRHNRVTSQINFRGSAEGSTILGGPEACPRENFAKLHLKIRIFVHSGSKF